MCSPISVQYLKKYVEKKTKRKSGIRKEVRLPANFQKDVELEYLDRQDKQSINSVLGYHDRKILN